MEIFAPKGLENYKTIINGDEKIKSISAASIVAKVFRDQLMIKLSEEFNKYAWERNFWLRHQGSYECFKKIWNNFTSQKRF